MVETPRLFTGTGSYIRKSQHLPCASMSSRRVVVAVNLIVLRHLWQPLTRGTAFVCGWCQAWKAGQAPARISSQPFVILPPASTLLRGKLCPQSRYLEAPVPSPRTFQARQPRPSLIKATRHSARINSFVKHCSCFWLLAQQGKILSESGPLLSRFTKVLPHVFKFGKIFWYATQTADGVNNRVPDDGRSDHGPPAGASAPLKRSSPYDAIGPVRLPCPCGLDMLAPFGVALNAGKVSTSHCIFHTCFGPLPPRHPSTQLQVHAPRCYQTTCNPWVQGRCSVRYPGSHRQ